MPNGALEQMWVYEARHGLSECMGAGIAMRAIMGAGLERVCGQGVDC